MAFTKPKLFSSTPVTSISFTAAESAISVYNDSLAFMNLTTGKENFKHLAKDPITGRVLMQHVVLLEDSTQRWLCFIGDDLQVKKPTGTEFRHISKLEPDTPKNYRMESGILIVFTKKTVTWLLGKNLVHREHVVERKEIVDACVREKQIVLLCREQETRMCELCYIDIEVTSVPMRRRLFTPTTPWNRIWGFDGVLYLQTEMDIDKKTCCLDVLMDGERPVRFFDWSAYSNLPLQQVEMAPGTGTFFFATTCSLMVVSVPLTAHLADIPPIITHHFEFSKKPKMTDPKIFTVEEIFKVDKMVVEQNGKKVALMNDQGVWICRSEIVSGTLDKVQFSHTWESYRQLLEKEMNILDNFVIKQIAEATLLAEEKKKGDIVTIQKGNEMMTQFMVNSNPFALLYSNPKAASQLDILLGQVWPTTSILALVNCGSYIAGVARIGTQESGGKTGYKLSLASFGGDLVLADDKLFAYVIKKLAAFSGQKGVGLLVSELSSAHIMAFGEAGISVSRESGCVFLTQEVAISTLSQPKEFSFTAKHLLDESKAQKRKQHVIATSQRSLIETHLSTFSIELHIVTLEETIFPRWSALHMITHFGKSFGIPYLRSSFLDFVEKFFSVDINNQEDTAAKWALCQSYSPDGSVASLLAFRYERSPRLAQLKDIYEKFSSYLKTYNVLSLEESMEEDWTKAGSHVIPSDPKVFADVLRAGTMRFNDLVLALIQVYLACKVVVFECKEERGQHEVVIRHHGLSNQIVYDLWLAGNPVGIRERYYAEDEDDTNQENVVCLPVVNMYKTMYPEETYGLLFNEENIAVLKYDSISEIEKGADPSYSHHVRGVPIL